MTKLDRPWPPREKAPAWPWIRRRPAIIIAMSIVVAFAVGGWIRHRDSAYGPLEAGSFGAGPRGDVVALGGGCCPENFRLASSPSSTATIFASLSNRGTHAVTVTSIEHNDVVARARWSVYRTVAGGSASGEPEPWRDFPATVPAQDTIRLLLTIRRPAYCPAHTQPGVGEFYGRYVAHWQSLTESHRTTIDDHFYDIGTGYTLQVC